MWNSLRRSPHRPTTQLTFKAIEKWITWMALPKSENDPLNNSLLFEIQAEESAIRCMFAVEIPHTSHNNNKILLICRNKTTKHIQNMNMPWNNNLVSNRLSSGRESGSLNVLTAYKQRHKGFKHENRRIVKRKSLLIAFSLKTGPLTSFFYIQTVSLHPPNRQ